jgi:acyl-CoA synthetase (AMP-forming)/AMP-acid ligase II/lysophospholipase L1-like esterase
MRIICFGDSLTSCGGENGRYSDILQDRFPGHEFINFGIGGETFVDARVRLQADVLAHAPDVVVIAFGANDWWQDERPVAQWGDDLDYLILQIKTIGAQVVVLGVFGDYFDENDRVAPKSYGSDARSIQFQALEAAVAAKHECGYVANMQERIVGRRCCWTDRNHPNEYGNRHVADTIEPILAEFLHVIPLPIRKPTIHTVRDMWREAVDLAPSNLCVVDRERRLNYADADELVRRLAAGLEKLSDAECPVTAVYLPNCLEYFLLYWALMELGGVIVPLNTFLANEALTAIFANLAPDILIVGSAADTAPIAAAESEKTKVMVIDEAWHQLIGSAPRRPDAPGPETMDTAIIMHTSGTTGVPKGAVMQHHDLLFNATATINAQAFVTSDVHLVVNPMFHVTALYSSLPSAVLQKSPVIITADTSATGLLQLVADERITTFLSVPTIFQRLVAIPDPAAYDTSSLRLMAYAGSMMPVSTIRELQRLFRDVALQNFFGLTETTSATHVLYGEDADARPDSIGSLLPFVEAIVVDENLQTLPPDCVGELLFARENVITEYYNQPGRLDEALVEIDQQEWFRTGDLASVDAEGFFFIKGRKKDMIIVGGENVYAAEVEAVLMTHAGVREAAVKGTPATGVRESLGELIRAYVVTDGAELKAQELRRHCNKRLASYQVPHEVVFLERLPRNPAGKVVKAELD